MPTDTWVDVRLHGYHWPIDIVRQHINFRGTPMTTSRDVIMLLQGATELWLSSDYEIYSDHYQQTSFSGFPLTLLFDPLVVFYVARSTSLVSQINVRISYDVVNIDTANAWDSINNEYIAPCSGTYVISLSTGAYPEASHVVRIWVNNMRLASNIFGDYSHTGIDIISRTFITTLTAGDRLYTQLDPWNNISYSLFSSNHHQLTTLLGFLYSPHRSVPISWWVGRGRDGFVQGELYPVEFDNMLINQGNGWNETTNSYLVPLAGVYYIHLTTGTYYFRSKLELMRNGLPIMNVQVESDATSTFVTSRALILRLQKHEKLCIRLPSGYMVYSNGNIYVSFSGFRIYE